MESIGGNLMLFSLIQFPNTETELKEERDIMRVICRN
jgi:hypothetical protein